MMKEQMISKLRESAELKLKFAKESLEDLEAATVLIQKTLRSGGKLLLFGNGGSAADAQHIAAEFVNRCTKKRTALPAVALTADSSVLTSVANDSSFNKVFSRQIEALGHKNDIAIGLTTSGKSANVINGLKAAKSAGLSTLVFAGSDTSKLDEIADCILSIPSKSTPRVQELHITLAHIICEWVEASYQEKNKSNIKETAK